jgi:hypothetical protein
MKKATVDSLIRTQWWWRKPNPNWEFDPATTMTRRKRAQCVGKEYFWKGGEERAAWSYELLRRCKEAPSLPPYPEVTSAQAAELRRLFGTSEDVWVMSWGPGIKQEPNYSMPAIWNLGANDHMLLESFRDFIAEQRHAQGIKPRRGRAGVSSQGPRWRWVELLDLSREQIRQKAVHAHGDFGWDQRTFMEAKKAARSCLRCFLSARPASFTELLSK